MKVLQASLKEEKVDLLLNNKETTIIEEACLSNLMTGGYKED